MNNKDLYKENGSESELGMIWEPEDQELNRIRMGQFRSPQPRRVLPRPKRPVRRPAQRHRRRRPRVINFGDSEPGSQGSEYVRWLQTILNQVLNLQLPVDGLLDVQTRGAIRSFQEKNGLLRDGIVGPPTEAALIAASKGRAPQTQATASEFEAFDEESLTEDFAETWQGEVSEKDPQDRYLLWVQKALNMIPRHIWVPKDFIMDPRFKLKEDGKFGTKTRDSIEKFKASKFGTVGVLCPDAERALLAALPAGADQPPGVVEIQVQETTPPPGRTIYVDIPLQIPLGDAQSLTPIRGIKPRSLTGIFIRENYCTLKNVNLIVFLHGNKARKHEKWFSIDRYWKLKQFLLREEVNKSQKNVILVAPTLGPFNEPGSLTCPGGFDKFLKQVMEALKKYGPYAGTNITPSIGNIILACHSGSGKVMQAIAMGTDSSVTNIQEYWAFEPSFMGTSEEWKKWAELHPNLKLYIYYLPVTAGQGLCQGLKGVTSLKSNIDNCMPNVFAEKATVAHDNVPARYLRDRIQGAQFLLYRTPCQRSGTGQSILPIRQIFRSQEIPFDLSNESGGVELPNNYWGEDVWQEEAPRNSPDYIKWVQQSLNQIMGLRLAVDGALGSQTRSAIRRFQQQKGLKADGIVGEKTEAAIKAAFMPGSPAKVSSFPYVKDFSGPAAECTAALKRAGKTRAEALTIINDQIGVAIAMLRKAATNLKRGSRSSKTKDFFLKIFRVKPEFVPTWLKQTETIKDRGDVVAVRCMRVADLLTSGKLRFFCAINSTNCPDCKRKPTSRTYACSSYGKHNVVCLGPAFWDAMKAGDIDSVLATLMHEPFHIYYGRYVTQHERRRPDGTLESVGKFGGIYCIQKFVFETNARTAPQRVNQWCADTVVRKELEFRA